MNIVVCLKQIIGVEEKIEIKNGRVSEEQVEFVINPYDEYAVEEAIRWKEKLGGEVTVVTVGPDRAESTLRTALAMGADRGIHVNDAALFGDEAVLSKVLAQVMRTLEFDLILAGHFAADSGSGQTALRLAEELGIPHIGSVVELQIEGRTVRAKRDAEGDVEIVRGSLPLLITAQQGLNDPRYPSLPGILKAKKKPIQTVTKRDLPPDFSVVPQTVVIEEVLATRKRGGRILQGEIREQVKELANLLKVEAKVL